jgi:cyclophilin family peptidyl-prolyl cis-trans isomerase
MRRLLPTLAVLAVAISACGSSSCSSTADIPSGGASAQTSAAAPTPTTPTASGCKQIAKAPAPKPDGGAKKPTKKLDPAKAWTLDFKTSCGDFTVTLDLKRGPNAAASMVALARAGFFKNTIFHRIVPGFVIQGGDPTQAGNGGPGYSTVDKPPKTTQYTKGVVAMAKAPQEPAGPAGSQFYVVTGDNSGLTPDYAVLGRVTNGMATVDRIGALGDQNEKPTQTVELYDVTAASK